MNMRGNAGWQIINVNKKAKRAKYRALRYTRVNAAKLRVSVVDRNVLGAVS